MKKLFTLLFSFFISLNLFSQCLSAGITITSQTEIDNFAANYTGCIWVLGAVTVQESTPGDITNLNGLSQITHFDGGLTISNTQALVNFEGLNNVTTMNGLSLFNNSGLTSLSGLESLADIQNVLRINLSPNLNDLAGLDNLTYVGSSLIVTENASLSSLSGLNKLAYIGGLFQLHDNVALTSLSGLNNLETIEGPGPVIEIINNDVLLNLTGLEKLTTIGGSINVQNNSELKSLTGMENITPAGITSIQISSNAKLSDCKIQSVCEYLDLPDNQVSIQGNTGMCISMEEVQTACSTVPPCLSGGITFSSQEQIDNFATDYPGCTSVLGSVIIEESVAGDITNLNGLSVITSIERKLYIRNTTALTDLTGLENLIFIGKSDDFLGLHIEGNMALTSLTGLEGLTELGELFVKFNPVLPSLTGLENLTTIGITLDIVVNDLLTDLTGLEKLNYIGASLGILGNPALVNLKGLENLSVIAGLYDFGSLSVDSNASLLSLAALKNLTTLGLSTNDGHTRLLSINNNPALTSLEGLENIAAAGFYDLSITNNISLSTCEVQSVCDFLDLNMDHSTITGNATGCETRAAVETACISVGTEEQYETIETISIYPNPAIGNILISSSDNTRLEVYDLMGKKLLQETLNTGNNEINLSPLPNGLYLFRTENGLMQKVSKVSN